MTTEGTMTAPAPDQIVRIARNKQYSAERLAMCFNNMPLEVAQDLLDGTVNMTAQGRLEAA